jgi:hypothetical protein
MDRAGDGVRPSAAHILRRLSGGHAPAELADIECQCGQAVEALRRVRRENVNFYIRAALRRLDEGGAPCASVREIVRALRRFGRIALR